MDQLIDKPSTGNTMYIIYELCEQSLPTSVSDNCSVFNSWLLTFKLAVELLFRSAASFGKVTIHFDNSAAILALSLLSVR